MRALHLKIGGGQSVTHLKGEQLVTRLKTISGENSQSRRATQSQEEFSAEFCQPWNHLSELSKSNSYEWTRAQSPTVMNGLELKVQQL